MNKLLRVFVPLLLSVAALALSAYNVARAASNVVLHSNIGYMHMLAATAMPTATVEPSQTPGASGSLRAGHRAMMR